MRRTAAGYSGTRGWAIDFNEDQEQVVDFVYEEADARLIAAAPELLAAAESVMAWWEQHQYDTCGERGEINVFDEEPDFVVQARAAIVKAKAE
jgi:hypothetical protein